MKLDYSLSPYTNINSKWIKDLNIGPETIHYIEENIGSKLIDIGLRKDFINLTPKARKVKRKINEWDYIKLKKPLHCKRNHQENKKATN